MCAFMSIVCVSAHSGRGFERCPANGTQFISADLGARFAQGLPFGSWLTMSSVGLWRLFTVVALAAGAATSAVAQEPEATTREAAIEQAQAEKVKTLHPYAPGKIEALMNRAEDILVNGVPRWHPYFESADYGGGFTLGAGYAHHVSPYNMLDVRGSYTILGYKRAEAEFTAPRLFHRRGSLSLLGGWREAT